MSKVGDIIKELRLRKGLTQYGLAKKTGVGRSNITQLGSGKKKGRITMVTAMALSKYFEVSPSIFLEDEAEYPDLAHTPKDILSDIEVSLKAYIPVYGEIHANTEGLIANGIIDYVATTRSKTAPDTLRAYRVKGLCLEPGVLEGDTVIVDTSRSPVDTNLVICIIEGKASIKRYREDAHGTKWLENNGG